MGKPFSYSCREGNLDRGSCVAKVVQVYNKINVGTVNFAIFNIFAFAPKPEECLHDFAYARMCRLRDHTIDTPGITARASPSTPRSEQQCPSPPHPTTPC